MSENIEKQKQPQAFKNYKSDKAKEVVDQVVTKFNEFKQARLAKEKKWDECIKAFLNQHNHSISDARKWRSQVYVPLSYEAATNIYSNLKRALFPTDSAFFSVEGRTPEADMKANLVKLYLLYQLDEMSFITKFASFLKQMVIIGNSAAAIYWKKIIRNVREVVDVPVYDEIGQLTGFEKQELDVEKLVYDGPELECINMYDIVFDPSVSRWEDGMVIHRTYRTLEQVMNNPVYKNTDDLEVSKDYNQEQYITEALQAFDMQHCSNRGNKIKLLSAYGDFKVGNTIYYDYIAVVADDSQLIRFEPNPYHDKPFVFCTYESVPNELYGVGAIEPGLGIQYMVNTFSNQKADVLSLIINGMWAYVDDGILDPEEIVARPGALIPVKDPNNIRPLHPDSSVQISYNEIAQLKAEYQEVTGATKYFTGGPNVEFSKTATEVAALQQAGIVRFSEVIQNVEELALKRTIKLIFSYNMIFAEDKNQPGLANNISVYPYNSFRVADFNDYNFRIVGANSSMSRDIRVNKLLEFIKLVGNSEVLSRQINIMALIQSLYRELGFKDEASIFRPSETGL